MALRRIIQISDDNPVLRRKARPVHKINRQVRKLLDDMVETMREADGVGLAGPQVGMDLAIFVAELPVDMEDPESEFELFALINPEITERSEEQVEGREACLSIPDLFGDVPRHIRIRVEALDRFGEAVELELENFAARVFQHEIDHLHGILFLDRVTGLDKVYKLEEDENGETVRVALESLS